MYKGQKVSVALPVYNGAKYIGEALQGFINDPMVDEIVISDDQSNDGTWDIVASHTDPRIKLIKNPGNRGQFSNFNSALAQCHGEFTQLFSHDDIAKPGFIESQLAVFDVSSDIGLVYSSCKTVGPNGVYITTSDDANTPNLVNFEIYLHIAARHGSLPPSISSVMVRQSALKKVGLFNPDLLVAGDLEFFNRVAEQFKIARNRTLNLIMRSHSESVTRDNATPIRYMREERAIIDFFKRHMSANEFDTAMKARIRGRGMVHGKYLLRSLFTGRFENFANAYAALSTVHSPVQCMLLGIVDFFAGKYRATK